MKRFTIPCDFGGKKHPFHVYIGEPHPKKHPLQNQAWWLSSERGGTIPQDVMDSFEKLFKISQENNVSFEDLCVYALGTASQDDKTGAPAGAPKAATGGATGAPKPAAGAAAPPQMKSGSATPQTKPAPVQQAAPPAPKPAAAQPTVPPPVQKPAATQPAVPPPAPKPVAAQPAPAQPQPAPKKDAISNNPVPMPPPPPKKAE